MIDPSSIVLCYVDPDGHFAYFTTKPLEEQWGDDWNDAPYEHNAGRPKEPSKRWYAPDPQTREWREGSDYNEDGTSMWQIVAVGIRHGLRTPAQLAGCNSRYSVDMINARETPWLTNEKWEHEFEGEQSIWAGMTLAEFIVQMEEWEGYVYLPREFWSITIQREEGSNG